MNCLKNDFKIYIKIDIKTAATCFGVVTPSSGSALFVLAKVTIVKIAIVLAKVKVVKIAIVLAKVRVVKIAIVLAKVTVVKIGILTTVTLASTNNALPDDGVAAPKHVAAVLMLIFMYILKLFLRHFTCASVGE